MNASAVARRPLREPVSGLTHLAGALLASAGLVALLLGPHPEAQPARSLVAAAIYGGSLVALFLASSLYHLLPLGPQGIKRLRRLDHSMIFVLIAGSYTPFCLVTLRGPWGHSLLAIVWGLAALGLALKALWLDTPRGLTAGIYLVMGWAILVAVVPLTRALPLPGLLWLLAGGLCYSGGAMIYALRRPDPWPGVFGFHEIWHLWVLAGAATQWIAVYRYVISP